MKKVEFLFLMMSFVYLSGCASLFKQTESKRFRVFADRMFDENVNRSPEYQTYMGIKKDYGHLDDISDKKAKEKLEYTKAYLRELNAFKFDELDEVAKVSYLLLKKRLRKGIDNFKFRFHNYPINQMFGVHSSLPSFMMNIHQISNVQEAKDYISRLNEFRRKFSQIIVQLKTRQTMGIVPPRFVFPKVIQDSENIIKGKPFDTTSEVSPLFADFQKKLDKINMSNSSKENLINSCKEALLESVKPAYEGLIKFVKKQRLLADDRAGVWKFPEGEEFYRLRLESHTTTKMTADKIHQIGLKEVKRIHREMEKIVKQVGFEGGLKKFFKHLNQKKELFFPDTDEGRKAYLEQTRNIIKKIKGELPKLFTLLPKADLIVKAVEPYREKSAGLAFYEGPSPDNSRPGIYYVNLSNLKNVPKHEMEALAYHEAIPGHHMQISIQKELSGLPKFRKHWGYTAYTEGWGLYAEGVPKEIGFYKDPYSDFGRLSYELWRAGRLVVDTGLHYKKWTRERAIDYLLANTPDERSNIVRSIERYIVMPGQATAYKIGQLKILELKERAQQFLGDQFDIRSFHDEVLRHGSVPLGILEGMIKKWMVRSKK